MHRVADTLNPDIKAKHTTCILQKALGIKSQPNLNSTGAQVYPSICVMMIWYEDTGPEWDITPFPPSTTEPVKSYLLPWTETSACRHTMTFKEAHSTLGGGGILFSTIQSQTHYTSARSRTKLTICAFVLFYKQTQKSMVILLCYLKRTVRQVWKAKGKLLVNKCTAIKFRQAAAAGFIKHVGYWLGRQICPSHKALDFISLCFPQPSAQCKPEDCRGKQTGSREVGGPKVASTDMKEI